MKVLHVGSGNLYGGVETLLVTLARLRFLGPEMRPHFALCFEGRLSQELMAAGVQVHLMGRVRTSRPWTVWRARRRFRQLLDTERFDVVICHTTWPLAVFGPVARCQNAKLVFWAHGAMTGKHWLERWATRGHPALAISNSHFTARSVHKILPDIPVEILYCPVEMNDGRLDENERAALREQLGASPETVVIIQVSRIEPGKGHLAHLRALSLLSDVPNWKCWMVGGAQRRSEQRLLEELEHVAADLGIAGRVQFLGHRSDVPRLLSAADVFCQPNTGAEGFGLAFVEALHAALPVLPTAIGGAKEIVTEECGSLVMPDHPEDLAKALRRLIEDAGTRRQLGTAGPARAKQLCDPENQMSKLFSLLNPLVSA